MTICWECLNEVCKCIKIDKHSIFPAGLFPESPSSGILDLQMCVIILVKVIHRGSVSRLIFNARHTVFNMRHIFVTRDTKEKQFTVCVSYK